MTKHSIVGDSSPLIVLAIIGKLDLTRLGSHTQAFNLMRTTS